MALRLQTRIRHSLAAILLLGAGYVAGRLVPPRPSPTLADDGVFARAYRTVQQTALNALPDSELQLRAARGLLAELEDPYAALLAGTAYREFRSQVEGIHVESGVRLEPAPEGMRVRSVLRGSPGWVAGIRRGDEVLAIQDHSTVGLSSRAAEDLLSSGDQRGITLWTRTASGSPARKVTIRPLPFHRAAVGDETMLDSSIGYVALGSLSRSSAVELGDAVARLREQGARGVVIDLRDNPGGLLSEGIAAANLFLPPGALITTLEGRPPTKPSRVFASTPASWPDLQLALLVNGRTASAAELFTAALQDHGRAVVVGTPTYGKDVMQSVIALAPSTAIRLTSARWLPPNGRSLSGSSRAGEAQPVKPHGAGLIPDSLVADPRPGDSGDRQRDVAAELLHQRLR